MRGMPRAGQDDGEVQLLFRPWSLAFAKHGADFEQPDVPLPDAPVEFDPADQPRYEPAAEVCLILRERVLDLDRIWGVGWAER